MKFWELLVLRCWCEVLNSLMMTGSDPKCEPALMVQKLLKLVYVAR
jgi:hypothetical protein